VSQMIWDVGVTLEVCWPLSRTIIRALSRESTTCILLISYFLCFSPSHHQGQEDDELPETILAVVHWRKLDLEKDGLKIDFGDEATSDPHLPSNLPSSPLASFSTTPSPASARAIQKAMGSLMVGDTKQSPSKLGTSPARSTGAASPARSTDSPTIRSVVKAAGADDDDEFLDADEEFYDADP
jgi:hypothetical protein